MVTIDVRRLAVKKLESPRSMGGWKYKSNNLSPRSKESESSFRPPVGIVSFVRGNQDDDDVSENLFCIDDDDGAKTFRDDPLTWRGHPSSTMSDCQLVVSSEEESVPVEEYFHVHRAVLGASDHRCQYFFKLFRSLSASAQSLQMIKVALEYRGGLEVMPAMLDFVYTGRLGVHTGNAVALRYLALFFECKSLRMAVNKFIEQDFNKDTAIRYIEDTYHYRDSGLMRLAIQETAKLFDVIEEHRFSALDAEMLYEIVMSDEFDPDDENKLSRTLVRFFRDSPASLSGRWLHRFTEQIGTIRSEEARIFLKLVADIDPEDPTEDAESWRALTVLCFRCAHALAPLDWNDDPIEMQKEFFINNHWKEDAHSRAIITTLVSKLKFAQEQCHAKGGLHETIAARQKQVTVLEGRISGLISSIEKSHGLIQTKEAEINELAFDSKNLEADVSGHKQVVAKLEMKIGGKETDIRTATTKLSAQDVAIRSQREKAMNEMAEQESLQREVAELTKANVMLYKKIESDRIKYRARLKAQQVEMSSGEARPIDAESREPPPSSADQSTNASISSHHSRSYSEICREVATNLSHQIRQKNLHAKELRQEIELKNLEIEKTNKIMNHLNARLRFYEIVTDRKVARGGSPPSSGESVRSSPPAHKFPDNE